MSSPSNYSPSSGSSWSPRSSSKLNTRSLLRAVKASRPQPTKPFKLPVKLHPTQQEFFDDDRREVFFGGAAGGGKSAALLASALKYAHVPRYSAVLIRRSFTHLQQSGGLIPMSREWLAGKAEFNATTRTWTLPSGARLSFGYLDSDADLDLYQGGEHQFIGVDEAGQIPENRLRYLFSRLRKPEGLDVPLRMRFASNPGGPSHGFLKQRYLIEQADDRRFIRSLLQDNPSLNREEYIESLRQLDPLTRARLLEGDWDAVLEGELFKREWLTVVEPSVVPQTGLDWCRFWDRASSVPSSENSDPDWTVGLLLGLRDGVYYLRHIERFRGTPKTNEARIRATAMRDGDRVSIRMEQEPGSSGKDVIDHYARHVLRGFDFKGVRSTGNKVERAAPVASAAELGNLVVVGGYGATWVSDFLDEVAAFPHGPHDDQVDALSGAFACVEDRPFVPEWFQVLDV
jgi:predicted phage terminase large subunit-like protein